MKTEKLNIATEINSKIIFLKDDIEKLKHERKISIEAGRGCTGGLWSLTDQDDLWLKNLLIKRFKARLKDLETQFAKL